MGLRTSSRWRREARTLAAARCRANGRTSLHSACAFGQLACVRELLALGVDPEGVDNDGKKPVDLVTKSCSFSAWPTTEHDEILEVLRAEICRKREGGDQR